MHKVVMIVLELWVFLFLFNGNYLNRNLVQGSSVFMENYALRRLQRSGSTESWGTPTTSSSRSSSFSSLPSTVDPEGEPTNSVTIISNSSKNKTLPPELVEFIRVYTCKEPLDYVFDVIDQNCWIKLFSRNRIIILDTFDLIERILKNQTNEKVTGWRIDYVDILFNCALYHYFRDWEVDNIRNFLTEYNYPLCADRPIAIKD